jgi:hypothetical protein
MNTRPHSFEQHNQGFEGCRFCGAVQRHRRHQPYWWRITHRRVLR